MSKTIITNTTQRPVFIAGRMLGVGMSAEVDHHEVVDYLQTLTKPEPATPPPADAGEVEENPASVTDDEQFVAALKKGK